jgi:hypothetical protein
MEAQPVKEQDQAEDDEYFEENRNSFAPLCK